MYGPIWGTNSSNYFSNQAHKPESSINPSSNTPFLLLNVSIVNSTRALANSLEISDGSAWIDTSSPKNK